MNKIAIIIDQELATLTLAINHYIMTSDDMTVAFFALSPDSKEIAIWIPVKQYDPLDVKGFSLLKTRLDLISPILAQLGIKMTMLPSDNFQFANMPIYELIVPNDRSAFCLIAGLLVTPLIAVQWGSVKPYVDSFCQLYPDMAVRLRQVEATVAPFCLGLKDPAYKWNLDVKSGVVWNVPDNHRNN